MGPPTEPTDPWWDGVTRGSYDLSLPLPPPHTPSCSSTHSLPTVFLFLLFFSIFHWWLLSPLSKKIQAENFWLPEWQVRNLEVVTPSSEQRASKEAEVKSRTSQIYQTNEATEQLLPRIGDGRGNTENHRAGSRTECLGCLRFSFTPPGRQVYFSTKRTMRLTEKRGIPTVWRCKACIRMRFRFGKNVGISRLKTVGLRIPMMETINIPER